MTEMTKPEDRIRVFHGDSRDVLKTFPDDHFDSVVCDPPYALVSITKRFGAEGCRCIRRQFALRRTSR